MRYPKAAAFFAVFVLALAVFAGGGVYLAAGRDGCAVSGEVLAGDRSYAESFSVTQRAVVDGHLLINAGYLSADSGPGWSMAETAPVPEPPPSIALKDTDLDYSESWSSGTRHTTEIPLPFAQDIYDGLAAEIGGSEGFKTASAPLGSYTDCLPLHFVSSGISGLPLMEADRPLNRLPFRDQPDEYSCDSEFTLLDVFSLAAPEGSSLFSVLLLNPGYNTFSITMRSDTDFYTYSDCAFVGGVAICTEYEFAAVAVESGGEYVREALFCPRQQSGAPDGLPAAANYYPDRRAFAWDGERVAYLDWDNSSCDARLCVFEDGGLVYCEQFPGGMYAGVDAECTFDISARKETA